MIFVIFADSHRYTAEYAVKADRRGMITVDCLNLLEGVKRQEMLEKSARVAFVYSDKMNIFYTWYKYGVL
jgi:hypothetical protein